MRATALLVIALGAGACGAPAADDPSFALLGGDTTIFDDGAEAFAYALRNMSMQHRAPFQIGDGIFNRNWIAAPASPQGNDGLGPTYNAISCSACHDNNGRGAPPSSAADPFLGLLLRLSQPGSDAHGGPNPDPSYGDQFNQYAIMGVPSEGTPLVSYAERPSRYADGTSYSLRVPSYSFPMLNYGPLADGIMVSPRVAPQVVGLGLLEAVAEETIRGFAAQNGGHPNYVWDAASSSTVIGRFGWKANQPSLRQQSLGAFRGDIGITSTLFPTKNCPPVQTACAQAPQSMTQPNLEPVFEDAIVAHSLGLAIPARRKLGDTQALRGEKLFSQIGCATCHIGKMMTGTLADWPELSNQTIRPFTDLLLHDMGPDLADGRPDFQASGSEWRTPPLWGLGLAQTIDGYLYLMHDGRARGFAEAILWHGGQAATARDGFAALGKNDRDALVAFLSSL
jgi:CxxC motif-containing protein (DUF1111 family)